MSQYKELKAALGSGAVGVVAVANVEGILELFPDIQGVEKAIILKNVKEIADKVAEDLPPQIYLTTLQLTNKGYLKKGEIKNNVVETVSRVRAVIHKTILEQVLKNKLPVEIERAVLEQITSASAAGFVTSVLSILDQIIV